MDIRNFVFQEWLSELRQLLQDLQGPDGIVRARQPEANRDSNVSWSKIRAVYGPFKDGTTFEDLERKKTVTRMLGQKITIRKKDVGGTIHSHLSPNNMFTKL